jgi:hypothetical protein
MGAVPDRSAIDRTIATWNLTTVRKRDDYRIPTSLGEATADSCAGGPHRIRIVTFLVAAWPMWLLAMMVMR